MSEKKQVKMSGLVALRQLPPLATQEPVIESLEETSCFPLLPPGTSSHEQAVGAHSSLTPEANRSPPSPGAARISSQSRPKSVFQCKHCQKFCRDNHELTEHLTTHTQEKRFFCRGCYRAFTKSFPWRRHESSTLIIGNNNFICPLCKTQFRYLCSLVLHRNVHGVDFPLPCEECGKQYGHIPALNAHRIVHKKSE